MFQVVKLVATKRKKMVKFVFKLALSVIVFIMLITTIGMASLIVAIIMIVAVEAIVNTLKIVVAL